MNVFLLFGCKDVILTKQAGFAEPHSILTIGWVRVGLGWVVVGRVLFSPWECGYSP